MILLFPIGHEDMVVQRLPYVTIFIIALNILFFAGTRHSNLKYHKLYIEKLENIISFYSTHLDLDIEEIIPDDHQDLKNVLLELKDKYNNDWIQQSSTIDDRNELIDLIEDLKITKHSLPSYKYGLIPSNPRLFNYFTSIFMHGGFFHLLFNMIFLWLAGCCVEDKWGRPLYLGFYLLSGVIASYVHILMFPKSAIPLIGASGAIAGAMGAFLIRMYRTRIKIFYFVWLFLLYMHSGTFFIPAFVALPFWLIQQIYYAVLTPNAGETGGVAFWAHIGGFIFGAMIAFIIKKFEVEEKYIQPNIEDKISVKQNPKLLSAIEKFDQNNHEEALIDLNEFLQKNPNHLDANIILSQIYIKMNQKDDIGKVNKKIISIYLNEKNNDPALSTYLDIKKMILDFVLSPREQIHMAHLLEKEGNIVDVADAYERLIEKYPTANESMKAAVTYGNLCLNRLNQPEKALTLFQKAKERCDFYPEWTNRVDEGLKAALDKLNKSKKAEKKEKSPDAAEKQIIAFEMRLTKLYENGILLEGDNNRGLFKWEQIKYIGIGNIHLNHTNGNYRKIIDLVFELAPQIIKVVRIKEEEIEYKELFKNPQDDRNQEFCKLIRIFYHYSKTSIVPPPGTNDVQDAEFIFSEFPSLESYEASLISSLP